MTPHALNCRMLRQAGKLDFADLPPPKRTESIVDWLIRSGLAVSPQAASEGLVVAAGLTNLRDELLALPPCMLGGPEAQALPPGSGAGEGLR